MGLKVFKTTHWLQRQHLLVFYFYWLHFNEKVRLQDWKTDFFPKKNPSERRSRNSKVGLWSFITFRPCVRKKNHRHHSERTKAPFHTLSTAIDRFHDSGQLCYLRQAEWLSPWPSESGLKMSNFNHLPRSERRKDAKTPFSLESCCKIIKDTSPI